jgi:tetratricopeptide (TPR) repeat protein
MDLKKRRPKRLIRHLRKTAGILDIPTYCILLLGEMLQTQSFSTVGDFSNRAALWIAKSALPWAKRRQRLVAPITHLAVGYSYYMCDESDDAAMYLRKARDLFQEFPDSPCKHYYLVRCMVHLCRTLDDINANAEETEVAAEARRLLQSLRGMLKAPDRGKEIFAPESGAWGRTSEGVLFRVTHSSRSWWRGCLYGMIELSKIYVHTSPDSETNGHQEEVVELLLQSPKDEDDDYYNIERGLADCLATHGKWEESLRVWRRLLQWSFRYDEDEEKDYIQYRVINCLLLMYRNEEAYEEAKKIDLTHSLVHYEHGPHVLSLMRQLWYRTGHFKRVLRMSQLYHDLCFQKWSFLNTVTLYNCFYYARILKKLGKFDESIKEFKNLLVIVEAAAWPLSNSVVLSDVEVYRLLPSLRLEIRRSLAHVLRLDGKTDDAIFHYRKALEIARRDFSKPRQNRGTLKSIAYLYETVKDETNASIAYDQLHREYTKKAARDEFAILKFHYYRGRMFLMMGEFDLAAQLFRKAKSTWASRWEKMMEAGDDERPTQETQGSDNILPVLDPQPSSQVERRGTGDMSSKSPTNTVTEVSGESSRSPGSSQPFTQISNASRVTLRDVVTERTSNNDENRDAPEITEPSRATTAVTTTTITSVETSVETEKENIKTENDRKDQELEDQYPFGSVDELRVFPKDDRWWESAIESSLQAAREKTIHHDPIPEDRYDSDSDEELDDEAETIADLDIAKSPVGRRLDELVVAKFDRLPDEYEEMAEERNLRERYPWRYES